MAVLLTGLATAKPSPDKVLSTRDFGHIRRQVETLRGKKFRRDVPVYRVSPKEIRAITDRETDTEFPGAKLHGYEELLAWLHMVPPQTDLKSVYGDFCVDQVDGFYVSEDKEICIPSFSSGATNAPQKSAGDKIDGIVLSHEFTHALEDQYWPLDDPKDEDDKTSTDRGTAHQFVNEGSATREMMEAAPDLFANGSPNAYFLLWNSMHSDPVESALNFAFKGFWKNSGVIVAGVPETLARSESMPYSFGYTFCTDVMRQWGLDGLDYIYNHPLVSSAQVMHPKKAWEWREYPVVITMPEKLPAGWKLVSEDSVGEADIAVLFGCRLKNLNRGLEIARGWNGDHVALFNAGGEQRVLIWASSWESAYDAGLFAQSCGKEWPTGLVHRDGKRVIMIETGHREPLAAATTFVNNISFAEPPEAAARAAANSSLRRFNPFWSWRKDGDYTVSQSLLGILSRHDRNAIGAADTYLGGMLAESRRTTSFHKWELGGGWMAQHEAENRRGFTHTTLLPWGILASHSAARLPHAPDKTISRTSILWGLLGSATVDAQGRHSLHVLPFGLLFRSTKDSAKSSMRLFGVRIRSRR